MADTEPQVVVGVDQDTSGPEFDCPRPQPWRHERRAGRGKRDVVSNSQLYSSPDHAGVVARRCRSWRYHASVCATPVVRSVPAAKSSKRLAFATSYTRLWVRKSSRLRVSGAD